MARHYNQAVINSVSERIADAVATELKEQPWWLRYKGSIMLALQALAWVAGALPVMLADAPAWTIFAAGAIGYFITALVNRLTVDGVTPSMAPRLAAQAEYREQQAAPQAPTLPVYSGPTTNEA
ncbi:hypothetical protein HMPREF2692_01390 [Corynebacterium sp. HMSC036D03]|uniref:hypothetical protein n=1 Tax=Corynebacterium sp. HMSC036D03 TaxID=1715171 RepID=UPI0008A8DD94|nr:hypothetical protein [Corynebacterium sp. HMSC036D03]OHO71196.1 hypothetical protein HMPREF2692_01390 [Corynebacterium sp. HMSC036D03]